MSEVIHNLFIASLFTTFFLFIVACIKTVMR